MAASKKEMGKRFGFFELPVELRELPTDLREVFVASISRISQS